MKEVIAGMARTQNNAALYGHFLLQVPPVTSTYPLFPNVLRVMYLVYLRLYLLFLPSQQQLFEGVYAET